MPHAHRGRVPATDGVGWRVGEVKSYVFQNDLYLRLFLHLFCKQAYCVGTLRRRRMYVAVPFSLESSARRIKDEIILFTVCYRVDGTCCMVTRQYCHRPCSGEEPQEICAEEAPERKTFDCLGLYFVQ